jgi:hypothetical protein
MSTKDTIPKRMFFPTLILLGLALAFVAGACSSSSAGKGQSSPSNRATGVTSNDVLDGLVGYWRFNDPSNLGLDSSGLHNDGTPARGFVRYAPSGKIGGAAEFTVGSDAGITVPDSPSLDFTDGITIAAWVKMDTAAAAGFATVISKSDDSTDEPYVLWASYRSRGNRMAAFFAGASNTDDSGITVPAGSWQYVAMSYDGRDHGIISFYLDGVQVASQASNATGMEVNSSALHIGASPCGTAEDFSGLMDEVRLYNRALSAAEIASLYESSQY